MSGARIHPCLLGRKGSPRTERAALFASTMPAAHSMPAKPRPRLHAPSPGQGGRGEREEGRKLRRLESEPSPSQGVRGRRGKVTRNIGKTLAFCGRPKEVFGAKQTLFGRPFGSLRWFCPPRKQQYHGKNTVFQKIKMVSALRICGWSEKYTGGKSFLKKIKLFSKKVLTKRE